MRAKLVENINFERGKEPYKALDIGLGETKLEANKAIKDLKELGINATARENDFNPNIIELEIPGLNDHQASYLPEEEKNWIEGENTWGWGIYELEDGEMVVDGGPWEKTLEKIIELLV